MQKQTKATPAVLATPRGLAETVWEVPTMQAHASTGMAPAGELRLIDRHPPISGSTSRAAPGNLVFDELLAQLAELVAAKVADRLARQEPEPADDWLDTRGASEYLGIHRDSLRRLAGEKAIPAEQAGAGCRLFFRRSDLDAWRRRGSATVVGIRSRCDG
ncbi:MAG: helix-turn-helix domain-containing protein [Solirubrobacterales bacterium]|nr:helix-turn-helix domain-containing protein [Solirubrobacterales bacterium]